MPPDTAVVSTVSFPSSTGDVAGPGGIDSSIAVGADDLAAVAAAQPQ